jgi:hypothetical protein
MHAAGAQPVRGWEEQGMPGWSPRWLGILISRIVHHGLRATSLWALDHFIRLLCGAPLHALSEIAPGIHLGGQFYPRGWHALRQRGITAVLNLRSEFDDRSLGLPLPGYLHLPIEDDAPPSAADLERAIAFAQGVVERGGGVYIHCASGVGRAATIGAALLVKDGLDDQAAWQAVRRVRPFIRPSRAQVALIAAYAASLRPGQD